MELISDNWDVIFRLAAALILGGVLGLEREFAGKMAGLRTYSLISVGSALFVIVSQLVSENFIGVTVFDPLRVASQIVVGVGFVGAGLVIFREVEHRPGGITTAAGLWVSAGIGMASGFGLYSVAVFGTIAALFILWILAFADRKIREKAERDENKVRG
ncbi:MAG: MgtC family protein [Candidatus Jorgensenbacteria bacterium GW2011_GWA1_48_13]|uniref:MgtC family protein n=1 Tax=Candidatus Jorgensenbacteria bacterium GW2011_GWB1_50_10 TaxID=1618665 RepID=A0A0G1YKB5_9BACT|nr:MAG: MgtC family protein [Parcubacteria group bacterium GW2011_GWC1_45_9]KKU94266.1 MAG: MgtC family protein [Candidatus Jorgensenbacteria bacterium GW2011_GWA1_48_13]KKW15462.1 MAG: MgtC family protein [Candidatus Jorgensenbacteria bacterium GW2011_GWB1_50_10]